MHFLILLGSGADGEQGDRSNTSHFAHKGTDAPSLGPQRLAWCKLEAPEIREIKNQGHTFHTKS